MVRTMIFQWYIDDVFFDQQYLREYYLYSKIFKILEKILIENNTLKNMV